MKKITALLFAILVGLGTTMTSCKKDKKEEPVPKQAENPISTYLTTEHPSVRDRSGGPYELGVVFSTSVPGKITQLGAQMKDAGSYTLTLWDADTKESLRQKIIVQGTAEKATYADVEPLSIQAGKLYVASINSTDRVSGTHKSYVYIYEEGGGDVMPFTKGNVQIHNSCYSSSGVPLFPDDTRNVKYELYGFPDFTFIPD